MIKVYNLSIKYASNSIPIFEKFNWGVEKAESWAVLGPSGCGKTTLLYLLAGLLQPASGSILIDGQQILRPRPQTGLILQDYGLLPWATVKQNCELGVRIRDFYGADGIHAPSEFRSSLSPHNWLHELGLDELSDKYPSQLSGGQRQRTAIARTLSLKPDLLLMDEPFSSLDIPTRENLQDLTISLVSEQGLTLILVTHSVEEAVLMGRKILLLKGLPNQEAYIIENSVSSEKGFRNTSEYKRLCGVLRAKLGAS